MVKYKKVMNRGINMFNEMKIAFYVTGGIASYKSVSLMRELMKLGAEVRVSMTPSATKFISPLTFQVLSKQTVHVDTFSEDDPKYVQHIHHADWAELSIIAPATANTIAKIANGTADNFVTSALLATTTPIFVVPAMNEHMYEHPATQTNIEILKKRGVYIMEPATGFLAEGYSGKGRFPDSTVILDEIEGFIINQSDNLPLQGKKIIVTAGGTKERIDPVRYISNDSSGKMGHAIAEAAMKKGAEVTLVTASELAVHSQIKKVKVESAQEMYEVVDANFDNINVLIMAAAVSDYTPVKQENQKMKKTEQLSIELKKTKDILKEMGQKKTHQLLVGFAAETENIEEYALKKLTEKNVDFIVANDVSRKDRGFHSNKNEVVIYSKQDDPVLISLSDKSKIAERIIELVVEQLG
ncbi:bifunctional phosphopantothenoylcysteine decarboxylase/phosphopantothenate--cysteine ligase CoaBC [Marinilactibacillus psychrotolerans]|uniref:Coenzyme A biosynthesis bifunctional protein CoaBC n=2 Tax=Marinilactibacillus psychrotolerans TaxID=191770 RepID=A0A1R4JSS1_9LACT|nr:bifunctional phosphopantothenoylcysteine decarboxylase/phosphopantothenate--cysteine ligase CoaBC [Marinilactibacillus psychrotolerans]GEQ32938.1 phosphopantothenoylcysteine decarboxylase / phosphopantothenate-cysteine ligase [Marinilactibacillus psychrotolerans]SJN35012.1 Phosphopantothenoylcysteine decarboxylase / Phosphopantothenoylcysteine synthetase [Marinilactibacillus psychrotolerans 42ea]